jgi:hypothetical protein
VALRTRICTSPNSFISPFWPALLCIMHPIYSFIINDYPIKPALVEMLRIDSTYSSNDPKTTRYSCNSPEISLSIDTQVIKTNIHHIPLLPVKFTHLFDCFSKCFCDSDILPNPLGQFIVDARRRVSAVKKNQRRPVPSMPDSSPYSIRISLGRYESLQHDIPIL